MTREEAVEVLKERYLTCVGIGLDNHANRVNEALDMAIEALSKPNYETDTEVRLAVTNRKKEKVILWDAFGEVEYYPMVRCKDCRHHGMRDCPVWGDDTTEDYMWCYYGERREE